MVRPKNHYEWLKKHLPTVFRRLNLYYPVGIITAHGDKASGFEQKWAEAGIHFYHGVAIYLLSYIRPYNLEVRETDKGWIAPDDWVIANKERFAFALPNVED